jgi:hypothetical protein
MDKCLQGELDCDDELLVAYKKMVLVFCSDPASQESKLGGSGSIKLDPEAECTTPGKAVLNLYHGVSPAQGEVLASDCTPEGRRLSAPVAVVVSDGEKSYAVSAMDTSEEKTSSGQPKSFTAVLTGPDPAFELDVTVELSAFSQGSPKEIVFPTPANNFWLNAGSLWAIGVSPKVKGALEAARSAKGGRAVVLTHTRQLAEEGKKTGATLGDFEKASIAMHFLKLSRTGIHHMINEKRAQSSWGAVAGYPMVAALVVVAALGAFRTYLRMNKGYVAPEEQNDETLVEDSE